MTWTPPGSGAPGPGWWLASDGRWYPPTQQPGLPPGPAAPLAGQPTYADDTAYSHYGYQAPSPVGPGAVPERQVRRGLTKRGAWVSALAVLLVGAVVGALVAVTSPAGTSEASAAVAAAAQATENAGSAQVQLNGSVAVDGQSVPVTGSGQLDFTDHALELQMSVLGHQENLVEIGDTVYEDIPEISQLVPGKSWVSATPHSLGLSGAGPVGGDNPASILPGLTQAGYQVTDDGPATVDGVATEHYSTSISPSQMQARINASNLPATIKQAADQAFSSPLRLDLYVDGQGDVRQLTESLSAQLDGNTAEVNLTMDLSDLGAPVAISAPPADQTIPLQQFLSLAQSSQNA